LVTGIATINLVKQKTAGNPGGLYNNFQMKKLILILLFPTSLFMETHPKELNIADLFQCIGVHFDRQKVFDTSAVIDASALDKEKRFPILVEKIVKKPQQYSLFGIPADEIYFALDSQKITVGVFVRLDNQNLVEKMASAIPGRYSAAGSDGDPFYYLWDYHDGCVALELTKNQIQFIPKIVRDDGLVIFFNCDAWSYMLKSPLHED
jgi:hypothetical protein